METKTFDFDTYRKQQDAFPEVTFEQFQNCSDAKVRDNIVSKNRILSTDTYNRTMNHIKWPIDGQKKETFTLSFRKTGEKAYNIAYGVKRIITEILELPITQVELDFAADAIAHQKEKWWLWLFDKAMWQKVIDEYGGYLPLDIKAADDGTLLKKWEPVMTVTWPSELCAHLEPRLLQICYESVVAWDAHYLETMIWEWRIIEVWYRSARSILDHINGVRATYVWGWINKTSNDSAATSIEQDTWIGTIAHRYLAVRESETEAFEKAIEMTEQVSLLVDLVDSRKWIDKAMNLKKRYIKSSKIISLRLDSGDLTGQAIYALQALKEADMLGNARQNQIIIEDIGCVNDMVDIDKAVEEAWFDPKKYIKYGLGWLLIATKKTRDSVSAGYKVTNTEDWATGKRSDDPGKEPIPWVPNVEVIEKEDGTIERNVVQEDEPVNWIRLLKTVYKDGELFFGEANDNIALDNARAQVKKSEKWITPWKTQLSDETEGLKQQVREKLKAF